MNNKKGAFMAKETQAQKILRLEKDLSNAEAQCDSYRAEANQLKKQIGTAVENTDIYKGIIKQLEDATRMRDTAIKQKKQIEKKYWNLHKEIEELQAAYNDLQAQLEAKQPYSVGRKPKLSEAEIEKIMQLHSEGLSMEKIAQELGCSKGLVFNTIHKNI